MYQCIWAIRECTIKQKQFYSFAYKYHRQDYCFLTDFSSLLWEYIYQVFLVVVVFVIMAGNSHQTRHKGWKATPCFTIVFFDLPLNYLVFSTTEEKILGWKTVIHHSSHTLGNILVIEKNPNDLLQPRSFIL